MRIFISHSTLDVKIIEAFVEKILCNASKINRNDIFCSSIEGIDVGIGKPILETIKTEIKNADLFIFIITPNFLKSDFCKHEIGVAWILDIPIMPILFEVPPRDTGYIIKPIIAKNLIYRSHLVSIVDTLNKNVVFRDADNNITQFLRYIKDIKKKMDKNYKSKKRNKK